TIKEAEAKPPAPAAREVPEEDAASAVDASVRLRPDLNVAVQQRLERLHAEAGSGQILLIDRADEVIVQVGESRGLNQRALAQTIAAIMDNSARLRGQLGGGQPAAVHYLTGSDLDVFCASVDAGYCLALLLGSTGGRGRLGTVWTYTRRTVGDLRELMRAEIDLAGPATEIAGEESLVAEVEPDVLSRPEQDEIVVTPPEDVAEMAEAVKQDEPLAAAPEPRSQELAADTGGDSEAEQPLSLESLQELLDLEPGDLAISALDAFWDEAALDQQNPDLGEGALSFQEAQQLGLLPQDFEPESDEDD
ncbi:MAG: hypothetical protein R3300_17060, partial [Candidatus Promineifilaceae bacterium]|nr:hypothetical protein [Candidatus Promineifilaceae bacterium]